MKSPAHHLALHLAQQGFGVFASRSKTAWSISVNGEPEVPDQTITIYDTGGTEPDTDELDIDNPTVQIRVRAKKPDDAWRKQQEIKKYLIRATPSFEERRVLSFRVTSSIGQIGRDETNRIIMTANYSIMMIDQ